MENVLPCSLQITETVLLVCLVLIYVRGRTRPHCECIEGRCPYAASRPAPQATLSATPREPVSLLRLLSLAQFEVLGEFELTAQEMRVAQLILEGKTYCDISADLGLSVRTVQYHAHNAMEKAGSSSRSEFEAMVRMASLRHLEDELSETSRFGF